MYKSPLITPSIQWLPSKWGTDKIEASQWDRCSQNPMREPYKNPKDKLVKEVTTFFEEALKGEKVEWKPFVSRVLPLMEPLCEYSMLYSDLRSVENPRGPIMV
jgi:hypothetical protein